MCRGYLSFSEIDGIQIQVNSVPKSAIFYVNLAYVKLANSHAKRGGQIVQLSETEYWTRGDKESVAVKEPQICALL